MAKNQITISSKGTNQLLKKLEAMGPDAKKAAATVVARGVLRISADAKRFAPVDTGRLRDEIHFDVEETKEDVIGQVISDVEYAVFQEFGTRFQRGTPYMRPAFNKNRTRIDNEFKAEIKKAVTKNAER